MQANGDNNTTDEPNPPPISLFVDTSINRPSTSNLMVESDQEDEEDPYSNIGISPTAMAPTAPIVNEPITVSIQSLRKNSSVVMLSDDEQDTDQEQESNQYMQPVSSQMSTSINSTDTSADKTSAPISSTQVDTITQIPSSTNELLLPQKVSKQINVKNIVTDIGKRYFTRFQKKQKSGDNQVQETVKGKQKKKDLEMQISVNH